MTHKASALHGRGCGSCASSAPAQGFLAPGHWVLSPLASFSTGNQTATQIYPRPDNETSSYARHRNIYYDGSTVFKNIIPIIARAGAFPYVYQIIEAPVAAGASMGASYWTADWTTAQAVAAGYGDLWLSPTGTVTSGSEFWIRVWDQTRSYIDVVFTSGTTSSTSAFIFVDPLNGVDTNAGDIAHPIKTLTQAYGATQGTTTYANVTLVIRGTATLPMIAQSASFGISAEVNKNPMAMIAMPGESVTVDLTNAGKNMAFDLQTNADDEFYQGMTFENGPATSAQFSCFYSYAGSVQNRLLLHNLSFPNIFTGSDVTGSGASELTLDDPNPNATTPLHTYIGMKAVSETNRTKQAGDTNNVIMFTGYKSQYGCLELCSATGAAANYGYRLKLGNSDWTVRGNLGVCSNGFVMGTSDFTESSARPANNNIEYCFNTIVGGTNASLFFNQADTGFSTNHYAYRNSIIGAGGVYPSTAVGPFAFSFNAIQFGSAAQAVLYNNGSWQGGTLPSTITNDGTQNGTSTCQAQSGVLDTGTYALTGTYRSNYLYQYGAEIG